MRVVRQQGARVSATFDTASAAGEGKKWIATKDCNVFLCCYQGGGGGGGALSQGTLHQLHRCRKHLLSS